ncbi:unnamed protein product [Arabis nemorensis]|uniref:Uncharacterized protein n=1 Tax=Arabis nemorensis TaxID=586526 RepID=A0A565AU55_9BRAS|nr:unnamed protein product [Arabis nemorensis]
MVQQVSSLSDLTLCPIPTTLSDRGDDFIMVLWGGSADMGSWEIMFREKKQFGDREDNDITLETTAMETTMEKMASRR